MTPPLGFHSIHWSPMFGGHAPLLDIVARTAEAGFDALGLDSASVEAHGSIGDVAAAIADAGLRCSDVLVLLPDAPEARRLGELAAATGAPWCVTALATPMERADLVRSLRASAEVLADFGCRIALEFTPYSALPTLAEAVAVSDDAGCALVIDSLHFFRSGAPWDVLASLTGEQIGVVQWNDVPATRTAELGDESRNHRLLPGHGDLPLRQLADAIRATGYDGAFSAEILSADLRASDPATTIPLVHAALTASTG